MSRSVIRGKGCNLMVMMGWGPSRLCLSVLINPVCKVRNQIEKEAYHLLSERASQEIFPKPGQEREVRSTSCLLSFLGFFRLKQKRLTASQHSLCSAKLETSSASLDDPPKSGLSASGLSVLHSIVYITQQAEEARCKCKNGHHKPSLSSVTLNPEHVLDVPNSLCVDDL